MGVYAAATYRAAAEHPLSMSGHVQAKARVITAMLRRAGLT